MTKQELTIRKLRTQVSMMREIIILLDKTLSVFRRKTTPDLPPIVYEDVE